MEGRNTGPDGSLFPKEIIEFSTETFISKVGIRSQLIYSSIVALLIVALASLPLIKVPISIQSRGAIRAEQSNTAVTSPVTGRIMTILATENSEVRAGQPLIRVESSQLELRHELLLEQLADLKDEVTDLETLLELDNTWTTPDFRQHLFKTHLYQSDYYRERRAIADLIEQAKFAEERSDIKRSLYRKQFVSRSEFEETEQASQRAANRLALFVEDKRNQWQVALRRAHQQIDVSESELREVENEQDLYQIVAPAAGVVQQIETLKIGSYLAAGQVVAVVSPNENLQAEVYVSTRDIGLITQRTKASFQIDAFNHLEWGQVKGSIFEISKDIYTIEGQPMFRILCQLERHSLTLSNGAEGRLKKGMTFTARFEVARRTLFQLLRDQIDDWFSPYDVKQVERESTTTT